DFSTAARTTKNLAVDKDPQIRHTLDQLSEASEHMNTLSVRLDSLRGSLQHVAGRVDQGDGTLGKLVSNDSLYVQLHGTVASMKALSEKSKKNRKKTRKPSLSDPRLRPGPRWPRRARPISSAARVATSSRAGSAAAPRAASGTPPPRRPLPAA